MFNSVLPQASFSSSAYFGIDEAKIRRTGGESKNVKLYPFRAICVQ